MSYLCRWHCLFSNSGHENCMKINWVCTVCRELYFKTIKEGSLDFIFVCAHEYICLLPFGTSCAFSTWGYKNSWGTPWSPVGIPAQSEFRGDGKFDCEVRPGAWEELASPAWLAARATNARDTTKVYIWRLDTGCGRTLHRKCHSHNTPGKRHNNTWVEPLAGNCTTSSHTAKGTSVTEM